MSDQGLLPQDYSLTSNLKSIFSIFQARNFDINYSQK